MVLSIISVFQFSRLVVVVLGSSNGGDDGGDSNGGDDGGDDGGDGGSTTLMTQMVIVMEFMIIGPVANSNTVAAVATTLKAMFVFGFISVQLYLKWVGKFELTSLDNINI